jgi:hypothetical protein
MIDKAMNKILVDFVAQVVPGTEPSLSK